MRALISNIGAFIKAVKSVVPVAFSGTTAVNGTSVDRLGFGSLVVAACTGAATGTPDAAKITFKVEDSADNSTFADYKPDGANVATFDITAASTAGQLDVDLSNARRYIRVTGTPAFTGGTTPTLMGSAMMILGGSTAAPI